MHNPDTALPTDATDQTLAGAWQNRPSAETLALGVTLTAYSRGGREAGSPATNASAVSDLSSLVKRYIGEELVEVETLLQGAVASRYAEVEALCRQAAAMGGKRLRPTLVWLAARAIAPQEPSPRIRRDLCAVAAAVELVHAASLVHDDVMDGASLRRHQATIVGKAGNSAAVLLGDLLFTRAYALAANCRSTYPARQLAAASTKLCEGELRQQVAAGEWSMPQSKYRSLLKQKTGALCAVSCRLGAWRVGGDRTQILALHRFGNLLGVAFQIHDDWLDYWGTEQVGKTLGTDLLQSKPTLPLIRLLQTASPERRTELLRLLQAATPASRAEVLSQLQRSDAGEYTLRVAQSCARRAQEQLASLPASPAKECLEAVAAYSVRRSA